MASDLIRSSEARVQHSGTVWILTDEHCRLCVHATPAARRNAVGGVHDGALRVSVTAPADKGRANKAITKLLAKQLGVAPSQISLSRGSTGRRKVFLIDRDAITPDVLNRLGVIETSGDA